MTRMKPELVAFLSIAAACQNGSDLADAKRTPKPPPPESARALEVTIAVEVDGAAAPPLDAGRLDAVAPDYVEDDKRGWNLASLLGETARRDGVVFAVAGADGPEVLLRSARSADEPQPALLASRRGEVVATMVSPQDPFPGYHGRGGRLGRSGTVVPRVVGVRKIRVYLER